MGEWRTLESQGDGIHPTLNISSVESDARSVTIHYDTTGWGTVSPSTVIAVVDETLALEGVFVGASGGRDRAVLQFAVPGVADYIRYDGSEWVSAEGRFDGFQWSSGTLTMNRPVTGLARNGAFPQLTARQTPYDITLGLIGRDTIKVEFHDAAGNLVTSPDTDMTFFVYDPAGTTQINPNRDFDDRHGNIWFFAMMVEIEN